MVLNMLCKASSSHPHQVSYGRHAHTTEEEEEEEEEEDSTWGETGDTLAAVNFVYVLAVSDFIEGFSVYTSPFLSLFSAVSSTVFATLHLFVTEGRRLVRVYVARLRALEVLFPLRFVMFSFVTHLAVVLPAWQVLSRTFEERDSLRLSLLFVPRRAPSNLFETKEKRNNIQSSLPPCFHFGGL